MNHKEYTNNIGTSWHNRCWMLYLPTYVVDFGKAIGHFFDPLVFGDFLELVIFISCFCEFEHHKEIENALHFAHHLLLIPLSTMVGLYCIFKQPRPGRNKKTGKQIGSIYGMPSGDSFAAAAFGVAFMDYCFPLGIILMLSIPFSRVVRGYHTIPQTVVGIIMGSLFTLGLRNLGKVFFVMNWIFAFLLPFLVIFDPACAEQKKGDIYNFHAWLFSNIVFLIFDIFVCGPEYLRPFAKVDKKLITIITYFVVVLGRTLETHAVNQAWTFTLSKKKTN